MNPKKAFVQSPHREPLERWVVTKDAEAARDAALLTFINEQPRGNNINEAWDAHSQLVGAKRILEILFNLPFVQPERALESLPNLKAPK